MEDHLQDDSTPHQRYVEARSKTTTRAKTMNIHTLSRDVRQQRRDGLEETDDATRPTTRAECEQGERPCPFVSCKYHLYLDVNDKGSMKINFPEREPWELEQTCALDIADNGGVTLEEVGLVMNLTRERVRQLEANGLRKLRAGAKLDATRARRHLPLIDPETLTEERGPVHVEF